MISQKPKIHRGVLAGTMALALLVSLSFFKTGSAHEPITTKVMFNKEVIRILQRNCLSCHSPGRIKADIPLTTYEEARPWAKAIKEEVLEKRMVPFQAVKGYGLFQHDYSLPQREVDLLISWIEGGAPRGAEKDYPKAEIEDLARGTRWSLGQPDLILQPQTESQIAAATDEKSYCSSLPTGLKEDRWVSAIDFQPGNGTVVYSASFYLDRLMTRKNPRSPAACGASEIGENLELLGQWVPGQVGTRLPDGIARFLPANSRILMKVNYRNSGDQTTDRSRLGFYFAKDPAHRLLRNIAITAPQTTIPAKAASNNYRLKATYTINETTEAVAIRPLLFPFAKSVEATAFRPDGTIEVLILVKNYRYDWQPEYYLKKPVSLPKGTRVEVTAYLDHSENNPNISEDISRPVKFSAPLCELSLTAPATLKQARR